MRIEVGETLRAIGAGRRCIGYVFGSLRAASTQWKALQAAGCTALAVDDPSAGGKLQPELADLLKGVAAGDIIVVPSLHLFAGSMRVLAGAVHRLKERGAHLRSLAEPWADMTSDSGAQFAEIVLSLAALEPRHVRKPGNGATRRRSAVSAPPRAKERFRLTDDQVQRARVAIESGGESVTEVAARLGVSARKLRYNIKTAPKSD